MKATSEDVRRQVASLRYVVEAMGLSGYVMFPPASDVGGGRAEMPETDKPANPDVLTSLRELCALYDGMDEKQFWSTAVRDKVLRARAVLAKVDQR